MTRVLYLLLAVVALASVVLSFDALHGLALLCGFTPALAPLLPVTIDAGAAAGSLVWLTRPGGPARRFGRVLALVLLAGSVVGNALGHGLGAYAARPAWWVVVAVSAVPPAVLAAVIHLGVLASRQPHGASAESAETTEPRDQGFPAPESARREIGGTDRIPAPTGAEPRSERLTVPTSSAESAEPTESRSRPVPLPTAALPDAAALIASGAGRRRLARELDISEHAARGLLAAHRVDEPAVTR